MKQNKIKLTIIILLISIWLFILNYKILYISNNFNKPPSKDLFIEISWKKIFLFDNKEKVEKIKNNLDNKNIELLTTFQNNLSTKQSIKYNNKELIKISLKYTFDNYNLSSELYKTKLKQLQESFWSPIYSIIPEWSISVYKKSHFWFTWTNVIELSYLRNDSIIHNPNVTFEVSIKLFDIREEDLRQQDKICSTLNCNEYLPFIFIKK